MTPDPATTYRAGRPGMGRRRESRTRPQPAPLFPVKGEEAFKLTMQGYTAAEGYCDVEDER